ncbi:MAG: hypothetical protein HYZ72_08275 [Deltaproteobacteria bacterium]|nr:hypothetical protein [Deltaproteobacteria bacterium]
MSTKRLTESVIEDAALAWLGELGPACPAYTAGRCAALHGSEIAAGEPTVERHIGVTG